MSYLLLQSDARRIPLADGSVHCVVTSPPYFSLRDYGVAGQIGLEETPDAFVAEMVRVFREVRRIMRDDATLWMNLGDSYAGSWGNQGRKEERGGQRPVNGERFQPMDERYADRGSCTGTIRQPGLKPKDLIGIPWRTALALQADGWYMRSDIIWSKPNPMPESVTDRPTKSHEYLFLLAKGERYYFDQEAVREEAVQVGGGAGLKGRGDSARDPATRTDYYRGPRYDPPSRNLRTVWTIPTEAYPGAHFATYPRKLVEPCIKAGTSEKGCCPKCGAGWVRVSEPTEEYAAVLAERNGRRWHDGLQMRGLTAGTCNPSVTRSTQTTGWRPGCLCNAGPPVPATVLDPFAGSGTTLVVANALGRRGIGCDLSRKYLGLASQRLERPHAPVPRPGREEYHPLFGEPS